MSVYSAAAKAGSFAHRIQAFDGLAIGLQHAAGTKVRPILAERGRAVPDGWAVRADNPKRGLVVEVPADTDQRALIGWLVAGTDPIHKVTIIPRGRALGVTMTLPEEDRMNVSQQELSDRLAFLLGGRAAEKIVYDEFSAGAENDLERATSIARLAREDATMTASRRSRARSTSTSRPGSPPPGSPWRAGSAGRGR